MADLPPLQAPTLAGAAFPATSGPRATLLRNLALAVAGSLLLVLAAKIKVPFWPVPMTMQTLAVIVIGMTLGSRLGFIVVTAYVLEGLMGLPVFANTPERGAGLAYTPRARARHGGEGMRFRTALNASKISRRFSAKSASAGR